jgi:hypothetical protein
MERLVMVSGFWFLVSGWRGAGMVSGLWFLVSGLGTGMVSGFWFLVCGLWDFPEKSGGRKRT